MLIKLHLNIFHTLFTLYFSIHKCLLRCIFERFKCFHLFDFGNYSLKRKKENMINVKLCIMLSHASKGHNLILMISYICSYLKLYYDINNVMLLSDDVIYCISLCNSSVVNKHQSLALSVCIIYCRINRRQDKHIRHQPPIKALRQGCH